MLQICCYIGGHPDCSLNEAAQFAGISQGTASVLVDLLCNREILKRTRDSDDRRRVRLSVTPATRCFLNGVEALIDRNTQKNPR